MRNIIILFISLLSFTTIFYLNNSIAEQIDLCLSDSEQYAVIVNSKDDCLEDERWMKISGGQEVDSKKKFTPLIIITPNKDCNTEGVLRTIGFDENNNGSLDENEVVSINSECKIQIEGNRE